MPALISQMARTTGSEFRRQDNKKYPRLLAQQHIWHSEHHSQEGQNILAKKPSKNSLVLVPEFNVP